ncbi:ATP-binding protein [Treponema sp. OMZ 787]|uniref:ATP-binding protein n=1 Tax=Treponema sp. OMZ 787 TaxID=2563669 RepID=UPI0020A29B57|nr:ATP-binding protein [Treponema sp. OMZ 787]UTC62190.1 ATP-binding protein [Treponema sp. OMZ 787]
MISDRKLPLGIQNFEKLRNENCVYIDKTQFVWKLSRTPSSYFLSRPRRFGKSLFLSTLEAYFLGKKELFKDLAIEKLEEAEACSREIWQTYPVFYLDLNAEVYNDLKDLTSRLNLFLSYGEEVYGKNIEEKTFAQRFEGIIKRAYIKTGKQVVILVDEYDKPLLQTMNKNETLNEDYRNILKAFFTVIKSSDKYLRFAFLTGVTKFSKISVFSDLNNLQDISMLYNYGEICGISQEELEDNFKPEIENLTENGSISIDKALLTLKQKYDGYRFNEKSKGVYNPFSLLNAFSSGELKNFWFTTGTPAFLIDFLKKARYNIPDLDGKVRMDEAGLNSYRAEFAQPVPILFQTGYLTIKDYNTESKLYTLGFPNDEVRYGFLNNLLPAYTSIPQDRTGISVWNFVEDIQNANIDGFMQNLKSIISGIPYDNFSEKNLNLREQNYQAAIYLIFALMNQFVETEVHSSAGRADCVVQTQDAVYLFELKLSKEASSEDAILQIKENNYSEKYKPSGKKIFAIGTSFDERLRTIKDWKTERLL